MGLRTSLVNWSANHSHCSHFWLAMHWLSQRKVQCYSHSLQWHSQKSLTIHTFLSSESQLLAGHSHSCSHFFLTFLLDFARLLSHLSPLSSPNLPLDASSFCLAVLLLVLPQLSVICSMDSLSAIKSMMAQLLNISVSVFSCFTVISLLERSFILLPLFCDRLLDRMYITS